LWLASHTSIHPGLCTLNTHRMGWSMDWRKWKRSGSAAKPLPLRLVLGSGDRGSAGLQPTPDTRFVPEPLWVLLCAPNLAATPPPFPSSLSTEPCCLDYTDKQKKKTASVFFLLLGLGPISAIGGPRGLPRSQRGWRPQQLGIRAWIRAWSPRCPVPPAPLQPGASGT
jgi:hypothetical protein